MCDARSADAVAALRRRKASEEKPLALMVKDVAMARALAEVSAESEALLSGPEAPIVLLPRRADAPVAADVAPGRPELGLMLPATPLHHLLLRETDFPVVATSGNRTDEPICTDEREALRRLAGMADLFLVHDRPIARHVDDSVARIVAGAPRLLRRARGWAPLPVPVSAELPVILGVGAHMKTAVALSVGRQVFLSQHVGDLETPEALEAFTRVVADFERLWDAVPVAVAHDLHPGYASTVFARQFAVRRGIPAIAVQHHHAHLAACLAENEAEGPALGVTWDGTGLGTDGTIWGGEFLLGDASGFDARRAPAPVPPSRRRRRREGAEADRSRGSLRNARRESLRARRPRVRAIVLCGRARGPRENDLFGPECADDDERGPSLRCGRLASRNRPEEFF